MLIAYYRRSKNHRAECRGQVTEILFDTRTYSEFEIKKALKLLPEPNKKQMKNKK